MAKWLGEKILALLGTLVLLAWWSFTGDDGGDVEAGSGSFSETELPSIVDGGGHELTVSLDSSEPVTFRASFECDSDDVEEPVMVGGAEQLVAGHHNLRFDVSGDCWYGVLEAGPSDPPVGASLSWSVHVNGELLQDDEATLDAPLQPNHGFFVQAGWDDNTLDEVVDWMRERS